MKNVQPRPQHKELQYKYNSISKYYELVESPLSFNKLPFDLKVEETQKTEQIKSKHVIHGRIKKGKYSFFTGLLETGVNGIYYGDHYEYIRGKKKNSFIIFVFSPNKIDLAVYCFNNFTLYPKHRIPFIYNFINTLDKKKEATTPPLLFKPIPTVNRRN